MTAGARPGTPRTPVSLAALASATEQRDWERWTALFAPDAVIVIDALGALAVDEALRLSTSLDDAGIRVIYSEAREVRTDDTVQRHHIATFTNADGRAVSVDCLANARFVDGLIAELDERIDLTPVIELAAGAHSNRPTEIIPIDEPPRGDNL